MSTLKRLVSETHVTIGADLVAEKRLHSRDMVIKIVRSTSTTVTHHPGSGRQDSDRLYGNSGVEGARYTDVKFNHTCTLRAENPKSLAKALLAALSGRVTERITQTQTSLRHK